MIVMITSGASNVRVADAKGARIETVAPTQFEDVPLDTCWGLSAVRIYRIALDTITGKRNLPGSD